MVKEEKTIDGFSVRRVQDSKLVARSQASKIPANKKSSAKKSEKKKVVAKKVTAKQTTVKRTMSGDITSKKNQKKKVSPTKVVQPREKESSPKETEFRIEDREERDFYTEEDYGLEEELFGISKERQEAHADFLAPVETFDLKAEDSGTSEGRLEEVEDEEVIVLKRDKKQRKGSRRDEKTSKLEAKQMATDTPNQKKPKKKHKVIKIVLIILLVLVLGCGIVIYFWGNDLLKKITGGEGDVWSALNAITNETYEPLKTDINGRTNVLVYGTSGYSMDGSSYGGSTHDGSQLTDSIMIVSLDQETGDVAMVSLPRDLNAGYTCTATGKVNEVYWCAMQNSDNEADGAVVLQAKVSEILGIDTQYYLHMNWGALVNIVDILGGVTVVLDEDINDYSYTKAVYSAGVEYTLTGEEALGLARARHGTDYGDFSRGASQQKILIAIKNKVLEKGLGLADALGIISAVGDNVRTNLNMEEIKTGMHILEEFDLDNIRQIPLVGEDSTYMKTATINGISYVIPAEGAGRYTQLQDYIARMLTSDPIVREGAEIIVMNGSERVGVAAEEREKLEAKGYNVIEIADAPAGEYIYDSIEIYDVSEGLMPETKKSLEDYYGVEAKEMSELPNGISPYGYDFIIVIGN